MQRNAIAKVFETDVMKADAFPSYGSTTDDSKKQQVRDVMRGVSTVWPDEDEDESTSGVDPSEPLLMKHLFDPERDFSFGSEPNLFAWRVFRMWFAFSGILAGSINNRKGMDRIILWLYRSLHVCGLVWYMCVNMTGTYDQFRANASLLENLFRVFLMGLTCVCSLQMGSWIMMYRKIEGRIAIVLSNTTRKSKELSRIKAALYSAVLCSVFISFVGASADIEAARHMMRDPEYNDVVRIFGLHGIYLYQVACIFVNMQLFAGYGVLGALLLVTNASVHSAFRRLHNPVTSFDGAIARIWDIDIFLSHLGHKVSMPFMIIWVSTYLRFFIYALYHVLGTPKPTLLRQSAEHSSPYFYSHFINNIFQPGFICIYIFVMIGYLNKSCSYLRQVSGRFALMKRHEKDKSSLKAFADFAIKGGVSFQVQGITITLWTAWKALGGSLSTYLLLLNLKRNGFI